MQAATTFMLRRYPASAARSNSRSTLGRSLVSWSTSTSAASRNLAHFSATVTKMRSWGGQPLQTISATTTTTTTTTMQTRTFAAAASYSMELLKKVRSHSGAPIVECKKALAAAVEEASDATDTQILQAAMDWLRQHGAAKASSKVANRETEEGLVAWVLTDDDQQPQGALVQVAAETDFAGRSDTFVQLVQQIAQALVTATDDSSSSGAPLRTLAKEAILAAPAATESSTSTAATVKDMLDEAIVAIRENISVSVAHQCVLPSDETSSGPLRWVGYVHNRLDTSASPSNVQVGTAAAAVLVGMADNATTSEDDTSRVMSVGKKLAMHVVAAQPTYLKAADVPEELVEKERELLTEQALSAAGGKGPPKPEILQKMIEGRLRKFYQQICLLDQGHMLEDKNPPVGKVLKEHGMEIHQFVALSIHTP